MTTESTDLVLTMTRRFDAPPERVFDAWVNPETNRRWLFASPADEAYSAAFDVRVGGAWTMTARREGIDYTALGEYLEVDPPRRLSFTFAMPQFSPNSDVVTVEIEPDGDGSLMTFTQSGVDIAEELRGEPADGPESTEWGWAQMFAALVEVVRS